MAAFNVEIFVDYGSGFEPDGEIGFESMLDYALWFSKEKLESISEITEGDYKHKRIVMNGKEVWNV